jgi:histidyl-tRNA synthetase
MSHRAGKLSKQLSYAQRKGIPYVWFPPFEDGNPHEVKAMSTGDQKQADVNNWIPGG